MIIALLFLILFAILFPRMLRFLFVLLLLGAIMVLGGAHAADTKDAAKCPAFYLTGVFYRAANICDRSWLQRPGLLITTSSAAQCNMSAKKAKNILKQGEDDFDAGVINRGQKAACDYVNTEMTTTENNDKK